jgi:hypothetical protein
MCQPPQRRQALVLNSSTALRRFFSACHTKSDSCEQINNVIAVCRGKGIRRVADLGSGDGRIVIALAKEGFHATGYELNPWLVWWSRCARACKLFSFLFFLAARVDHSCNHTTLCPGLRIH